MTIARFSRAPDQINIGLLFDLIHRRRRRRYRRCLSGCSADDQQLTRLCTCIIFATHSGAAFLTQTVPVENGFIKFEVRAVTMGAECPGPSGCNEESGHCDIRADIVLAFGLRLRAMPSCRFGTLQAKSATNLWPPCTTATPTLQ